MVSPLGVLHWLVLYRLAGQSASTFLNGVFCNFAAPKIARVVPGQCFLLGLWVLEDYYF